MTLRAEQGIDGRYAQIPAQQRAHRMLQSLKRFGSRKVKVILRRLQCSPPCTALYVLRQARATRAPWRTYHVSVGFGEVGEAESHPLGEWTGQACGEAMAQELAYVAIWDERLNTVCGPRFVVRQANG